MLTPDEWRRAETLTASRRRSEFLRARYLVRRLTGSDATLPAAASGAPSWPAGWVGSITHKDGYVGVTALPDTDWLSIGIDVEDPGRMREAFTSRLCRADEASTLQGLAVAFGWTFTDMLTLCFSFKEAVFKAHFPLGQRFFYFHDAEIIGVEVTSFTPPSRNPNDSDDYVIHHRGTVRARLHCDTTPSTPSGTEVTGDFLSIHTDGRRFIFAALGVRR
jgi:4'-phosphopantetheinyl transferase EntD